MYCYAPSGNSCTLPSAAFYSSQDPPNQTGNCSQTTVYTSLQQWQAAGEDPETVLQNPFGSLNAANDDYSLAASPGVGFVIFDPSQAGRTSMVITPRGIAPTFPAQSYAASQY